MKNQKDKAPAEPFVELRNYERSRSYAGFMEHIHNTIKSERLIFQKLSRQPFAVGRIFFAIVHRLILLGPFLLLEILALLFWPLGSLKNSINVAVCMSLLVPAFHLIFAAFLCSKEPVEVKIRVIDQHGMGVEGIEIAPNGEEKHLTQADGMFSVKLIAAKPKIGYRAVARAYCPDCFLDLDIRLKIHSLEYGVDTVVFRKLNFGERLFEAWDRGLELDESAIQVEDIQLPINVM